MISLEWLRVRPEAAQRPTRKLFDVVNAILCEFDNPLHDQVAKRVVDRATNCTPDLLESRVHVRSERGRNLCSHHLLPEKKATHPSSPRTH